MESLALEDIDWKLLKMKREPPTAKLDLITEQINIHAALGISQMNEDR